MLDGITVKGDGEARKWSEISSIVRRCLGFVEASLSEDDAEMALRGANLLAGMNKGIGDAIETRAQEPLEEQAFAVLQAAMLAVESLES